MLKAKMAKNGHILTELAFPKVSPFPTSELPRQDFQAVEHTQHTDFDNPEGNRSGAAGMNEDGPVEYTQLTDWGEGSQRCLITQIF